MERLEVSLLQFKLLIKSIELIPDHIKDAFLEAFYNELQKKEIKDKISMVRGAYNIFNLYNSMASKNLFLNGRIVFSGDMGKIFFFLAEELCARVQINLFPGCDISRDFASSYISLCLNYFDYETKDFLKPNYLKPLEIVTVNTKYNNQLISQLKEILI